MAAGLSCRHMLLSINFLSKKTLTETKTSLYRMSITCKWYVRFYKFVDLFSTAIWNKISFATSCNLCYSLYREKFYITFVSGSRRRSWHFAIFSKLR